MSYRKAENAPYKLRNPESAISQFDDFELLAWFQIALATKPVLHRSPQRVDGHAMSNFEQSIARGKGVVEDRIVGKVAHRKVVDLLDRAIVPLARIIDSLNRKSPRKHGLTLNESPEQTVRELTAKN